MPIEKAAPPHERDAMPTEFDVLRIRKAALSSELDAETMRNDALPIEQAASTQHSLPSGGPALAGREFNPLGCDIRFQLYAGTTWLPPDRGLLGAQ